MRTRYTLYLYIDHPDDQDMENLDRKVDAAVEHSTAKEAIGTAINLDDGEVAGLCCAHEPVVPYKPIRNEVVNATAY